ncbi:MAG: response regulator [Geobacteraceae bacterium]|nr:response regulator [Geobacteraceae bacterium]
MLLTDVIMPDKNGVDAAREIKKLNPGIKVLITSGYTMDIIKEKTGADKAFDLIMKPIHPLKLALKVREVLDGND